MSASTRFALQESFTMGGTVASFGATVVIVLILASIALAKNIEMPVDAAHKSEQDTITGTLSAVVGVAALGVVAVIVTTAMRGKSRAQGMRPMQSARSMMQTPMRPQGYSQGF